MENSTQKGLAILQATINETFSEDNDLTEQEWYQRIGLSEEEREKKFKGWSEEQINQYFIYQAKRENLLALIALNEETKKFSSFLTLLDTIAVEKGLIDGNKDNE
jgi:hypothetical protein